MRAAIISGMTLKDEAASVGVPYRTFMRRRAAEGIRIRRANVDQDVIAYLYGAGGIMDYAECARLLFGDDSRKSKARIYVTISRLMQNGRIQRVGESFVVIG